MITVLIADDHPMVRRGIRSYLEMEPDLQVVGEAATGLEALALVRETTPDVLLLDLMIPDLSGLEVARLVTPPGSRTRVVVFSMHGSEGYVLEALHCGAHGYVLKDAEPQEVLQAIRAAAAGHRYLGHPLSDRAIEVYAASAESGGLDPFDTLTERERGVFSLATAGRSASAIAATLGISPRTAETHRTNLMRKLGLHSQTDLVRYALEREARLREG